MDWGRGKQPCWQPTMVPTEHKHTQNKTLTRPLSRAQKLLNTPLFWPAWLFSEQLLLFHQKQLKTHFNSPSRRSHWGTQSLHCLCFLTAPNTELAPDSLMALTFVHHKPKPYKKPLASPLLRCSWGHVSPRCSKPAKPNLGSLSFACLLWLQVRSWSIGCDRSSSYSILSFYRQANKYSDPSMASN